MNSAVLRPAVGEHPDAERDERERLQLQRMERALVRAYLAAPATITDRDYECLRYALGLARLHVFRPAQGVDDVTVDAARIAPLRAWMLEHLYDRLRGSATAEEKLVYCVDAVPALRARCIELRRQLLVDHSNDFDATALDREAGRRALVIVAGGGGGAGYVYAGAFARLMEDGLIPDYIVGNSIGAILGLFRAQRRHGDVNEYTDFARKLKNGDIFSAARRRREFCLPGLLHLHLRALHQRMSVGDLRRPLRLDEMEIPLDLVVAGIRRRPYERMAADKHGAARAADRWLPMWMRVAARTTRLLQFFSADLVEPIVLGRDSDTRQVHAVDAAGFSAAVPTILQYEPGPGAGVTREIFSELMASRELAAIVDGGVADNVPARAAWRGVAAGRAASATRNAYYLAFDCFFPRFDAKNMWLWPITQTVQRQMRVNRVYADTMVRFDKTLSPLNIVPSGDAIDLAVGWGYQQMDGQIAEVHEMQRTVSLNRQSAATS
ncbi:patatin-like phospholipase family protein [Salinisphaera aquimarina]|uniref:Patatin-like phospholipase family protein n=1 Tax=Salinisphaera aquimarina TaxID=2094031 RepID=A0ABV7EPP2_9GAMM